ncbi:Ig-like domain-containing protein [Shewanella pealeana]|nr:hypothetical protein [Shewanella pealeana]
MMMRRHVTEHGRRTLIASTLIALMVGCGSDNNDNNDNNEGVNLPPVAGSLSVVAVIGEETAIDVLAESSDPEGGELTLSEAKVVNGVGEVRMQDNQLWFESDTYGLAQIEYVILDDQSNEGRAKVDVEVKASLRDYVGTDTCLSCHTNKASFQQTGHNFKFTKVEKDQMPEFPFTTMEGIFDHLEGVENSLGAPMSWADVSYVLGGYQRQGILLDKNGYMVNGTKAMVDVVPTGGVITADRMVPFAPGAGADAMPYKCGTCHNTGWRDYTSEPGDHRNRNRQDDLIGMEGTFALQGVQCEACHGAGSDHVKKPSKDNITRKAEGRLTADLTALNMAYGEPVACGECHTKEGERYYPSYQTPYNADFGGDTVGGRYKEYFEEGRTAGDALMAIDPDTGIPNGSKRHLHCADCHNPHQSTNFQDKPGHEQALITECQDCHGVKEFADGATKVHAAVADCTDCHMPINSHLFKIDLSEPSDSPYHFSKDGKFRQPWLRPSQSCKACHADDYDDRASRVELMHR